MPLSTRIPQIGTHSARLWLGWKTSAVAPLTGELHAASTRLKRLTTEITSGESLEILTSWLFHEEVCVSRLNTWIFAEVRLAKALHYRFFRVRTVSFFTRTVLLPAVSLSLMSAVLLLVKTTLVCTMMLMKNFVAQQGITQRHSGGLAVTWPSSGCIVHCPISQSPEADQR